MFADDLTVAEASSYFIQRRRRTLLFPNDTVKRASGKKVFISTAIELEKNVFPGANGWIRQNHVCTHRDVMKKVARMNRSVLDAVQMDVVLCERERALVYIIEIYGNFRVPIGDKKTDRTIPTSHIDHRVDILIDRNPFEQKATPLIERRLTKNTVIG